MYNGCRTQSRLEAVIMLVRVGIGQDSHRFGDEATGKPLVLGGVRIPGCPGLEANSDGDVVLRTDKRRVRNHRLPDTRRGGGSHVSAGRHYGQLVCPQSGGMPAARPGDQPCVDLDRVRKTPPESAHRRNERVYQPPPGDRSRRHRYHRHQRRGSDRSRERPRNSRDVCGDGDRALTYAALELLTGATLPRTPQDAKQGSTG